MRTSTFTLAGVATASFALVPGFFALWTLGSLVSRAMAENSCGACVGPLHPVRVLRVGHRRDLDELHLLGLDVADGPRPGQHLGDVLDCSWTCCGRRLRPPRPSWWCWSAGPSSRCPAAARTSGTGRAGSAAGRSPRPGPRGCARRPAPPGPRRGAARASGAGPTSGRSTASGRQTLTPPRLLMTFSKPAKVSSRKSLMRMCAVCSMVFHRQPGPPLEKVELICSTCAGLGGLPGRAALGRAGQDRHDRVAREAQHHRALGARRDVHHHDRVRALADDPDVAADLAVLRPCGCPSRSAGG